MTTNQSAPVVFALLRKNVDYSKAATVRKLETVFADTGGIQITRIDDNPDKPIVVTWNNFSFALYAVANPIPKEQLHASLASSPEREGLSKIVDRHRAHLVISVLNTADGFGKAIDLSLVLMIFAEKFGKVCDRIAWYWQNSQRLVFKETFEAAVHSGTTALDKRGKPDAWKHLPLDLWVDARAFSDGPCVACRSEGLSTFTGYEMETNFVEMPVAELKRLFKGVVRYLFVVGDRLEAGHSIALNSHQRFTISFSKHSQTGKPTLILTYEKDTIQRRAKA